MGFKIISNRDKDGNFIASADHWDDAKIDVLLKKYNPNGKLRLSYDIEKEEKEKAE